VISIFRSLRSYLPFRVIEPPVAEMVAVSVWRVPSGSIEIVDVELPDLNLKSKPLLKAASFASTESPAGGVDASGVSDDAGDQECAHVGRLLHSVACTKRYCA
jgi:hypothetical protein